MFQSVQSQVTAFSMLGNYAEIETAKEGCYYMTVTSVTINNNAIIFNSYESQVSFKLGAFERLMDMMKLKSYIRENIKLAAMTATEKTETTVVTASGDVVLDIKQSELLFKNLLNKDILI